MILRRLTTALRKQDWFTVLIETLIVVLGVFLGIQLGNWNEARVQRAQETELLRALHQEIETSIRLTQQKSDAILQVVDAGRRSLAFLEAGESCGNACWPVLVDFFHASQWQSIEVDRSTYDEMRRQGFPRSREIVDAVEGYLAQNATLSITNHLPTYRSRVRQLIPLDAQEFYWATCYILEDGAETYVLDCAKGISDAASARAVGKIADTPDIALLLTEWAGLHSATPADLEDQNMAAERALDMIEAELERRS
ncbi:hypothetical protein D1224_03810 [Henriciella barbarensis]|uniref:Uncharacterized protein n=1 Tax=Henriciella barbarensis TaxID=86342 RepID=A0A399QZ53_9PROT|nr:hypothetical protein [Henriciella barbarensis]RIJ23405.1 hypothetical protein D1224_03810 [Henriciella barbarensis]